MLIDSSYIKKELNVDMEDENINFLINHYFNYIIDSLNITTTLEEQEISLVPVEFNEEEMLTQFQECLIYGIGCNLQQTNNIISEESYCDKFENLLNQVDLYLNDTTSVGYIRKLLFLDEDDISNNELEFLINHYKDYYKELLPNVKEDSAEFKQAVYLAVACHIFKTRPEIIISPSSYTVDEVQEEFGVAFDKEDNTWCDLADMALSDLKKKTVGLYGIKVFDRPGARSTGNYYGPQP